MSRVPLLDTTQLRQEQAELLEAREEIQAVVKDAQQIVARINLAMVRLVGAAARVESRARYTQPEPMTVQTAESPVLLRPSEVAEVLRISKTDVYQLHKSGRLPSVRPTGEKGRIKFRLEDVRKYARDPEAFVVYRTPIELITRPSFKKKGR